VRTLGLAAGLLVLVLAAASPAPTADTGRFAFRATVTSVVDGDTIAVRLSSGKRERVRLVGIDTPELNARDCFAREAAAKARQLAQGRRIRLLGDATQDTRDRYGRLLAYVALPNGMDLGRQLIALGFARVYVYRRPFQRLSSYRAAENTARTGLRGLWTSCTSQPPPPPPPGPPPPAPPPGGNCHASYPAVCIPPPPPDLDCGQISARNFQVRHDVPDPDPHRFDGERDGVGCET
jgi:endonuclease YncB( thermonuclease family)